MSDSRVLDAFGDSTNYPSIKNCQRQNYLKLPFYKSIIINFSTCLIIMVEISFTSH